MLKRTNVLVLRTPYSVLTLEVAPAAALHHLALQGVQPQRGLGAGGAAHRHAAARAAPRLLHQAAAAEARHAALHGHGHGTAQGDGVGLQLHLPAGVNPIRISIRNS